MGKVKAISHIIAYTSLALSLAYGGYKIYNNIVNPDKVEPIVIAADTEYYKYPSELEIIIEKRGGNNVAYLADKSHSLKQPILDGFQLGNANYRLKGLLEEGTDEVIKAGDSLLDWLSEDTGDNDN